jgi:hypothetical protein
VSKLEAELSLMRHRNSLRLRLATALRDACSPVAEDLQREIADEEALDREVHPQLVTEARNA